MRSILQMQSYRNLSAVTFTAVCLSLSACDGAVISGPGSVLIPDTGNNIISVLQADDNFDTLSAAIEAAGLNEVLSSTNTYTLFAPNDAAFDALGTEAVDALLADTAKLKDILLYHVISGQKVNAAAATALAGTSVPSANTDSLAISLNGESLLINDATVTRADIDASNGIIHEIDMVLTPPEDGGNGTGDMFAVIQADDSFDTLTAALEATGLNTVLANTDETYTLFAPNDAAFDALGAETVNALLADTDKLTNILLYHVISARSIDSATAISLAGTSVPSANSDTLAISLNGAELMVNDATVTRADISTTNGLLHEIDTVLMPPVDVDLVTTLSGMPNYSTLVSLLQSTDLDTVLADTTTSFTVFAPNNAAFTALDAALLAGLAEDPDALRATLLGHAVAGTVSSEAAIALAGQNVTTVGGAEWPVAFANDTLSIGPATVVEADVAASNGVIHGIDAVLN